MSSLTFAGNKVCKAFARVAWRTTNGLVHSGCNHCQIISAISSCQFSKDTDQFEKNRSLELGMEERCEDALRYAKGSSSYTKVFLDPL